MKRCILSAALCIAFAMALPAAARRYLPPVKEPAPALPADADPDPSPEGSAALTPDGEATLTLLSGGEVLTLTMREYLPGVLAGEMPASFAPEALRAQAAAARTYAMYRMAHSDARHPQADLCSDPACCQVWLSEEALRQRWGESYSRYSALYAAAAEDTDGAYLTWEGEPILACFHAASPGQTESCEALWGTAVPYLVSVDTPEGEADVPGFVTTAELTPEALRQGVAAVCPQADFSAGPEAWIGERVTDVSGRVASIRIGGAALPGTKVREIFALRSACFTLEWTGDRFVFTVTGSGHGVGMSQYGANVMARSGADWKAILAHYYPGTALVNAPA